jgi:hypothetical protein
MPLRVVEVGCSASAALSTVKNVDIDEGYVTAARHRLPDRVFRHADVGDSITCETLSGRYDLAISFDLLSNV